MDKLTGMAVFARVVEAQSFTAAAGQLGMSKSAVSKTVAALEDRLDASPEDFAAATLEPGAAEDDVCVLVFRRRVP